MVSFIRKNTALTGPKKVCEYEFEWPNSLSHSFIPPSHSVAIARYFVHEHMQIIAQAIFLRSIDDSHHLEPCKKCIFVVSIASSSRLCSF